MRRGFVLLHPFFLLLCSCPKNWNIKQQQGGLQCIPGLQLHWLMPAHNLWASSALMSSARNQSHFKSFSVLFFSLSQKKGKWRYSLARQTHTAKPHKSFLQRGAKSIPNTPHRFYLHNFDVSLRLSGDEDVPFPSVKLGHTHARAWK